MDLLGAAYVRSTRKLVSWRAAREPHALRSPSIRSSYLRRDNPRLAHLELAYQKVTAFPHSLWKYHSRWIDMNSFRGDGNYLRQGRSAERYPQYLATAAYVEALGLPGLLPALGEDGAFGCQAYTAADGLVVSRDLLDSVLELTFLSGSLGFIGKSQFCALDIGAGYGRFAHRCSQAFPASRTLCADGVAVSTFLSEFYLDYRGANAGTMVVPLHELDRLQHQSAPPDLAVNIHSWDECGLDAIRFWLALLSDLNVKYLFLVPHQEECPAREPDGSRPSYLPQILAHGYRIERKVHKYQASRVLQTQGICPVWYYLFKRS